MDEWAKKQNCAVWETPRIKFVSGALLAGKTVRYASPWAIVGTPPAGVAEAEEPSDADFALTMTPQGNALHLIPRIGVLGVAASAVPPPPSWKPRCSVLRRYKFGPGRNYRRRQH